VLSRTRTFYDSYVDESSFGAPPTKGDEVRVEELDSWNGSTPVYVPIARNTYDANGRATASTDARGYTSTTAYTTANGGLVTQTVETNAINQATTTLREPAWDLPAKITDANGVVTDLTYDGLGRLMNVWLPGRAKATQTPSLKFSYLVRNSGGPTAVITENLLPTGAAYKKRIDLYDGFLRPRQTQTSATGGGRLLTDTFYTTAGRKDWTSAAYYDSTNAPPSTALGSPQGQIPSITVYAYDGAGRTTDTIFKALGVEKWRTTNSYGGDRVTTLPPAGDTATTTITDARGQTTKLLQDKSFADVGSSDPSRFDATSYTYTLLGQLRTVTDQAGSVWGYGYDLRGRQIQAVDPDRGTTTSGYDVVGNRTTVTSPLGTGTTTVAYIYDALNRRTTMRDDSAAGPLRAEWVYDTLPMGKGQITSATRYSGGNPYTIRVNSYDAYSRPTSISVVLPPTEAQLCAAPAPDVCTYTTTLSYKPNGQPFQVTLPAAADLASEKLTIGYNDIGDEGTLLSASQIYVYSVIYDKLGQLTQRQLGAYGSRVAVTSSFDEPTGRPTGMNVVPELKPEAARYAYSYDNAGNVTKIVEAPAGQSADNQCFSYDYLSRLTEAWTPASGDCAAARSLAALGGPAPYWQSWTIDSNGNRLTETRHAATNTVFTYGYPSAGSARPHSVTRVTASGAVSWIHNYAYDNGGNTTNRPNAAGAAQTLTWDREGHLDTVVDSATTTRYIYGPDGNRLIRSDGTGKTLYLPGGTEVRYDNASAAKKAARYYTHSGQTIAVRTASGLSWITTDHHGTAELAIDAATLTVAKRRALPFGEARGSVSGTWPGAMDKGFVGGTQDPTGLVHLGAREYDPLLGRFISDDPVTDTDDPQQLQGYLYANNSPETESDPNGMCWSGFGAVCNAWNGFTGAVSSGASTVWHGVTGGWPPIRHWISDKFAHFRHSVSDKFAHFRHWVSDKFAHFRHWVSDKFAHFRHWVSDKFARARHYVAVHGPNALKRAFHVARFIVNLPATLPGLLYAGASGADCGWAPGLMITCTGARRFAPKGGQTVGNVFTTRDLSVSPTVLEHETQHANQYAALGTMFPGLGLPAFGFGYAGASGFSWVTYHIFGERHDGAGNVCDDAWACYNIFEINADLHKGNYYHRP
jgi:RHS repeat-associated protein